jgi:hypothetical protein
MHTGKQLMHVKSRTFAGAKYVSTLCLKPSFTVPENIFLEGESSDDAV